MEPIKILHIEDDLNDVELIRSLIVAEGIECEVTAVDTEDDFILALNRQTPDIILADYSLPLFDGLRALHLVKKINPHIPLIFVSGQMGETTAIESLKYGATDYVLKTGLNRLGPAILRALHEKEEHTRRRLAEEKVLRLKTAIEQSADAVVIFDREGLIEYVNPAFEKKTGYLQDEVKGRNPRLLKSDAHDAAFYRDMWQTITSGRTWHKTIINRKKDRGLCYDETSISPLTSGKGDINGYVAIMRDITLDVELEKQRQKAERARRRLADIFLTIADDKVYQEVMDLVLENLESKHGLFGYIDENNDLVVPSLVGIMFPDCGLALPDQAVVLSHQAWAGVWSEALREQKAIRSNSPIDVPPKHLPVANFLFVPIVFNNRTIGLLAVANKKTDYTDEDLEYLEDIARNVAPILNARRQRDLLDQQRQEAETKLWEYSENLKNMVEERTSELSQTLIETERGHERVDGILKSVPSGLIVSDIAKTVVLMNRKAEMLFAIEPGAAIGQSLCTLFKGMEDCENTIETLAKEGSFSFDYEMAGQRAGDSRVFRVQISGLFDKEGAKTGYVLIMNDITHDREIDKAKTEFISLAAHEFKTPLTSILGFSEILLNKEDLDQETTKKYLSFINGQALSLTTIVTDLLDISQIEAEAGFTLNQEPCDAEDMINKAVSFWRHISAQHDFMITRPEKPVKILVDRVKFAQVLKNVISNAVKYSPQGGEILVNGTRRGEFYEIAVTDQGVGMTPEQKEKIFDKFYKADFSDSAVEGTGLGMTIVKYLVAAHGGEIQVESKPGKGTTVCFTVPLYKEKGAGA